MFRQVAACTIFLLVTIPFAAYAHVDAAPDQAQRIQYAAKSDDNRPDTTRTPTPSEEQPAPKVYQPDCGKPQDHDEADLCVQRQAVDASRDAVGWAKTQTVVAFVGLAGVLVSLILAGWAAYESRKGAKASRESADVARRTFTELQRPWLFLSIEEVGLGGDPQERTRNYSVSFVYKNLGGSPAVIESHKAELVLSQTIPTSFPAIIEDIRWDRVIPVGGVTETFHRRVRMIHYPTQKALDEGTALLCFYGMVQYRSVSGTSGCTQFLMVYDQRKKIFQPLGGEKTNRYT